MQYLREVRCCGLLASDLSESKTGFENCQRAKGLHASAGLSLFMARDTIDPAAIAFNTARMRTRSSRFPVWPGRSFSLAGPRHQGDRLSLTSTADTASYRAEFKKAVRRIRAIQIRPARGPWLSFSSDQCSLICDRLSQICKYFTGWLSTVANRKSPAFECTERYRKVIVSIRTLVKKYQSRG